MDNQQITKKEEQIPYKGSQDFFTGSVTINPIFEDYQHMSITVASGTFEAGARTAWHTHPKGQRLIVTEGVGLISEWNGKVHEFKAGDIIWCPEGIKHWHGAAPNSSMTHITITGIKDGKFVEWMEKVTDDQYNGERSK